MKVSKEQMAENRARILDAAAALFRERGFAGIGVSDLMKAAGLTHGGFYGHFASKEELMARASERALAGSLGGWRGLVEHAPDDALRRIVRSYLSEAHRDHPEQGCAVAALGADVARQGSEVRASVTQGVAAHAALLSELMPGATAEERERQAAGMRAVSEENKNAFFFGVDPKAGARKPKMAKALRRQAVPGRRVLGRRQLKAE